MQFLNLVDPLLVSESKGLLGPFGISNVIDGMVRTKLLHFSSFSSLLDVTTTRAPADAAICSPKILRKLLDLLRPFQSRRKTFSNDL